MKKLSIVLLVMLSFISAVLLWPFVEKLIAVNNQLKIVRDSGASYVCSYYGKSSFDNDFFYMNQSLSIKKDNQKIAADLYMLKPDTKYTFEPFTNCTIIKNGEMIISKNVANEYGLKAGDTLKISSALYGESFDYYIKEVIEPLYCFTEEYFVSDKGAIILGNSPSLVEASNLSLAFVAEEDLTSVALKKLTSLETYKESLIKEITISVILALGAGFLSITACFVLFELSYSSRIRKAIVNGFKIQNILLQFYSKPIAWSFVYFVLMLLFIGFENWFVVGMFAIPPVLWLMLLIPLVSCIVSIIVLRIKLRKV